MSRSTPSLRFQAHLRTPSPDLDAGLRGLTHYERRLPKWRYHLRQWLIPLVRRETPFLARMQEMCRSPMLDSYFAMTANLGTHTFFMTALPICFWCGYGELGTALIHMLAAGVYLSGYAKDLVCLPRPLSPPLQRITMSGSAALEYGFPSTHTTNAVSVAAFCLYHLYESCDEFSPLAFGLLVTACVCYATSISIGRIYCGMHGILDVVFGAVLGIFITAVRVIYGTRFDEWTIADGWIRPFASVIVLALAIRFHPQPADNCPCFDDSVAFAGVVMGISIGTHTLAHNPPDSSLIATQLSQMYDFSNVDVAKVGARMVGGILVIFTWRSVMKPILLSSLPPIFRFVDYYGLRHPRRYFLQARDYNSVPPMREDDNVIPPASDIPEMLSSIRRRQRTISVGPQSEADAREHIANRQQLRRDERENALKSRSSASSLAAPSGIDEQAVMTPDEPPDSSSWLTVKSNEERVSRPSLQVNVTHDLLTPPPSEGGASSDSGREDERHDRAMFSTLEKPRTRYDVEVITKVIVYAGIAVLVADTIPRLFYSFGVA